MPLEAPSWLNSGDTSWQITAATLVGLMSVPGLAVLYGGVMQKRWSINSMMLTFATFSIVLVVWVLWAFKMGFGSPFHGISGHGFFGNFIGKPGPVLSHTELQHQANIPLIGTMAFPQSALVYFQFVFAAITPILALGSVLGRVNFKAWIPFCVLWITFVYAVDAFLLWGGGFFAQHGAVDFSGGYVIHLSAGVAGFVAAAVIGPRLQRDREIDAPNNVAMVAVGAGLLWLGWNGFNGGDPYASNMSAAAAVLNTNLCTAVALLIWIVWDYLTGRKPSLIGTVNGMIVGLVAITPAAGYVNGWGAIAMGIIASTIVYFALNYLSRLRPVPQRRRHARRDLHPRVRRSRRRSAGRGLRRPADGAVLQDQQARPDRGGRRRRPRPRQRDVAQVAVPRRPVGDLLDRGDHVPAAEARRPVHTAADVRAEHGDRRRRRARPRGVPVRRSVARVSERDSGRRTGPAPYRPRRRPHDESGPSGWEALLSASQPTPLAIVSRAVAGDDGLERVACAASDALARPVAIVLPSLGAPVVWPADSIPEALLGELVRYAVATAAGAPGGEPAAVAHAVPIRIGSDVVGVVAAVQVNGADSSPGQPTTTVLGSRRPPRRPP